MKTHTLSRSDIKYLVSIYRLKAEIGFVHSINVADNLHVSKPSVTRAVEKLVYYGMVEKNTGGMLSLTSAGTAAAAYSAEKELLLKQILQQAIGSRYECPETELTDMAYALSDKTFRALTAALSIESTNVFEYTFEKL